MECVTSIPGPDLQGTPVLTPCAPRAAFGSLSSVEGPQWLQWPRAGLGWRPLALGEWDTVLVTTQAFPCITRLESPLPRGGFQVALPSDFQGQNFPPTNSSACIPPRIFALPNKAGSCLGEAILQPGLSPTEAVAATCSHYPVGSMLPAAGCLQPGTAPPSWPPQREAAKGPSRIPSGHSSAPGDGGGMTSPPPPHQQGLRRSRSLLLLN